LISLSYLTKKLTPSILSQVDDKVAAQKSSLESALNGKIQQFSDELKNGSATGSVYAAVTLANGKTLKGNTGTEVVLRSGSASCVASAAPGLMDTTAGGALSNGSSLSGNHLYLVTADGWGVRASGGSATLLVRGSYTIS
ncbi:MAG: hypothetical protein PHT34_05780, partial [Oscillospiraceae bacterium]|nr:hypothetical protein [Oscillospiraceae bacterium]